MNDRIADKYLEKAHVRRDTLLTILSFLVMIGVFVLLGAFQKDETIIREHLRWNGYSVNNISFTLISTTGRTSIYQSSEMITLNNGEACDKWAVSSQFLSPRSFKRYVFQYRGYEQMEDNIIILPQVE